MEEATKYNHDSVKDLKIDNIYLVSKLAETDQNVEKCQEKSIRLTTEFKDLRVDLQTVALETNQLKTSTSAAVGNDLQNYVHYFTQQLRGLASNIQSSTSRVETVELHLIEHADSNITNLHKYHLAKLSFGIFYPC